MKRLLLIVLPLLLIVGCSKEPINYQTTLNYRDGVYYTKDTNKPYSGPVFSLIRKGLNKRESILEDGKMITYKEFEWHRNGQKEVEVTYKDGKREGLFIEWFVNGRKDSESTYKNGVRDGLYTGWHKNGQKRVEGTYKDGEPDGLVTWWHENGQKEKEGTYKEWEEISSKCWDEDGNEYECHKRDYYLIDD